MSPQYSRFLVIFLLGFSSGFPFSLLMSTLQAWFAEAGMSVFITGTLSLLGLPYTCRMLWAPIVDRFSLFPGGRRKSWILAMQLVLLAGFNVMALMTPVTDAWYMGMLALLLAFFSATQDIAIDAQRIEYLPMKEHAMGAFLGVSGFRVAMLISGGVALVMAHYLGWAMTYHCMTLGMIPGILTIYFSREPTVHLEKKGNIASAFIEPLREIMKREQAVYLLLFIVLYKTGEAFTSTNSGIVMPFLIQGLDFSIVTIGYVNKIMGIISILTGGLLAGFILMHCSLFRSLLAFGLLQALTNILFVVMSLCNKNVILLAVTVISDNVAAGMLSTALVAFFMQLVDVRFTGTQFSILLSISTIPRLFSGPIAAGIQWYIGWIGLYILSVLFALLFIPFLFKIAKLTERREVVEKRQDAMEIMEKPLLESGG